jgi:hypothetical protein
MAKPQFTEAQCRAFADAANPHQWVLTADNLHEQAVALYAQRKRGGQLIRRGRDEATVGWDNTNKATFLLCALALENAIKAFLVYEHPEWVTDGYLHGDMCSHKLVALSERSSLIPYKNRDRCVLAAFEAGNESWMRYPCGRRADDVESEQSLPEALWAGYERVMRGYGNKLIRLLGKGWTGPYGVGGRWEMVGHWLGGGWPVPADYRVPSVR